MKQSDLKVIKECTTDMLIFLLSVCFVCVVLCAAIQNLYLWLGALYMIFLTFYKALVVADLESKLNEY